MNLNFFGSRLARARAPVSGSIISTRRTCLSYDKCKVQRSHMRRSEGPSLSRQITRASSSGQSPAGVETLRPEDLNTRMEQIKEACAEYMRSYSMPRFKDEVLDDGLAFRDPITSVNSKGWFMVYLKAIKMLFDPTFEVLKAAVTGPTEIQIRFTGRFRLKFIPLLGYKSPEIDFTGTSLFIADPLKGKVVSQTDFWDSVDEQRFFSLDGIRDIATQILTATLQLTPDLPSPQYKVIFRNRWYEVREYDKFMSIMTDVDIPLATASPGDLARGAGFMRLARYLSKEAKESMTTPVVTLVDPETDGKPHMAFPIALPGSKRKGSEGREALPAPSDPGVRIREVGGGTVACLRFGGGTGPRAVRAARDRLMGYLRLDGISFDPESYELARYNAPWLLSVFKRNELIIPIKGFSLPGPWNE